MEWSRVALFAAFVLGGCASRPAPTPQAVSAPAPVPAPAAAPQPVPAAAAVPGYRCDQGIEFTVRFGDGTAELDLKGRGRETLLRDAGGVTPQQTAYSSTRLRAEFGLEPDGRGAKLNFVSPPIEARCLRG